ncbi:MAG: hypothetical protein ACXWME_02655 [Syntrophales bacterium]
MPSLSVITVLFSLCFIVSFICLASAVYKKSTPLILTFTFVACVFFALLTASVANPGSHLHAKVAWFEVDLKTPSLTDKLLGNNQNTLEARNTDPKHPNYVIITAASTHPITTSAFNFPTGQQYVKPLYQSQDGKEFLFGAALPPGHKLQVATPAQVTVIASPAFSDWPNR